MALLSPKRRQVSPRVRQLRKASARRRHLRTHHPFPRFKFDAAWYAAIDALTKAYWRLDGRGRFSLDADGACEIELPDGRTYRARLRKHLRKSAPPWYEGFVACGEHPHLSHDEQLNADGAEPMLRPASLNLWPRQIKVSPARTGKDEG